MRTFGQCLGEDIMVKVGPCLSTGNSHPILLNFSLVISVAVCMPDLESGIQIKPPSHVSISCLQIWRLTNYPTNSQANIGKGHLTTSHWICHSPWTSVRVIYKLAYNLITVLVIFLTICPDDPKIHKLTQS